MSSVTLLKENAVEVPTAPRLMALFATAAVTAPGRSGDTLADTTLVRSNVVIDAGHVADFARVAGATVSDVLPPTYVHVLAFPLSIKLMADRSFPMPLPGMVHLRNRIAHHRAVRTSEQIDIATRLDNLRPHRKGRQVDILTEVTVGDELVWSSLSTYLSTGRGADVEAMDKLPTDTIDVAALPMTSVWKLPADQGRRYARVSGDRNPIHLSALSARPFGFKSAIVHGMWTKAACLAALEGRLPESFAVDVAFDRAVTLPGTYEYATAQVEDGWQFGVRRRGASRANLVGVIESI